MSNKKIQKVQDDARPTRLPNESAEYVFKREELRLAEIESMKSRERVAQLRRQLPEGAIVDDYVFIEGPAELDDGDTPTQVVRLSQLFTAPKRSLVIYHFMYGKRQTSPCPMCTLLIDGLNGVAHHLAQNVDFAIVAAADPPALRKHARRQGWDNLRLLSAAEDSTSNMTWVRKIRKEIRTRPSRFSPAMAAPCDTSTALTHTWDPISKNGGWIF